MGCSTVAAEEGLSDAEAWAGNHAEIFESTLAPKKYAQGELPGGAWHVSVSMTPGGGPAIRISLLCTDERTITARVRQGPAEGVVAAAARAHVANAAESPQQIASRIRFVDKELSSAECPALPDLAREFQRVRLSLKAPLTVSFHGTRYRFVTQDYGGFELEGVIRDTNAGEPSEPLVEWVNRARKALTGCGVAGLTERE